MGSCCGKTQPEPGGAMSSAADDSDTIPVSETHFNRILKLKIFEILSLKATIMFILKYFIRVLNKYQCTNLVSFIATNIKL